MCLKIKTAEILVLQLYKHIIVIRPKHYFMLENLATSAECAIRKIYDVSKIALKNLVGTKQKLKCDEIIISSHSHLVLLIS